MPWSAVTTGWISLDSVKASQQVVIRRIITGGTGSVCDDLGLHEGDLLICSASSATRLYLRKMSGRTVSLERGHARFIEAEVIDARTYFEKDRNLSIA